MTKNVNQDQCSNCKFYVLKDGTNGECHRHSPQIVVMRTIAEGNNTFTRWPEVKADDFCGDYMHGTR